MNGKRRLAEAMRGGRRIVSQPKTLAPYMLQSYRIVCVRRTRDSWTQFPEDSSPAAPNRVSSMGGQRLATGCGAF